jgi:hypothetical protein
MKRLMLIAAAAVTALAFAPNALAWNPDPTKAVGPAFGAAALTQSTIVAKQDMVNGNYDKMGLGISRATDYGAAKLGYIGMDPCASPDVTASTPKATDDTDTTKSATWNADVFTGDGTGTSGDAKTKTHGQSG